VRVPDEVARLCADIGRVPGVVGVALGGSQAAGTARPDSDWDLGVYYRASGQALDPNDVRELGYAGEVTELGAWGPIVNGGGWLTVDGVSVDVLFRDLDLVEHWREEADEGRFEVLDQHGYLVGAPTYILAGELAIGQPLIGEIPGAEFSEALATSAPRYWRGRGRVSLMFAQGYARSRECVCCLGMLSSAILCAAHAQLTQRREWSLNEKRLVERAGLDDTERLLACRIRPADLPRAVEQVGAAISLDPLPTR
jgi:predicted nucleotidyltransferase